MKWLSIIVFTLTVPSLYGQIAFSEVSKSLGIDSPTGNFGIAIGDFNNDGYDDLFIARDAPNLPNLLFINEGGQQFKNVSHLINDPSMRSIAGLWADVDNNGFIDLLVINRRDEPKQLYMNYGDSKFVNVTFQAGITDLSETKSANAADFNSDG